MIAVNVAVIACVAGSKHFSRPAVASPCPSFR
jgi:hypothetical protein